jgi:hypothetical protein
MSRIPVLLDEDVTALLGESPEEIERSAREMVVLELYRRHDISAGRAAELLDLDLLTFARWSGALGVPYFDTTPEDWANQLRAIEPESNGAFPSLTQAR